VVREAQEAQQYQAAVEAEAAVAVKEEAILLAPIMPRKS
jgi:hypothetical protein